MRRNTVKRLGALLVALVLVLGALPLTACEDKNDAEEAWEEMKDEAEDLKEEIEDEVDDRM